MSKFKVGEVVVIQSVDSPELNGKETTILSEAVFDIEGDIGYDTDDRKPNQGMWSETALRKLPPKDTPVSLESLADIFVPDNAVVEAV